MVWRCGTFRETIGGMSALALDIAISRASLGALRAQMGEQPLDEERRSAAQLRDHFERNRDFRATTTVTSNVVPNESVRQALERTLSRTRSIESEDMLPVEQSQKLIVWLDKLAEGTELSAKEVSELVSTLRRLSKLAPQGSVSDWTPVTRDLADA